jgi:hypothetical protein
MNRLIPEIVPGRRLLQTIIPVAVFAAIVPANASVITWGGPQNITSDAEVSTAGSLVGAFNLGATGVASTTVNGVTFVGLALNGSSSVTSGNFNLAGPGALFGNNGSFVPGPFALSASYQALLGSVATTGIGQPWTLTMSNLVPGANYQFQWWSSDNNAGGGTDTLATAGNSVSLHTTQGPYGPGQNLPGQFATGTFLADGTTVQTITFSTALFSEVNGFQLRRISVPDTSSTFVLFTLGLFGLAAIRREISRREKP